MNPRQDESSLAQSFHLSVCWQSSLGKSFLIHASVFILFITLYLMQNLQIKKKTIEFEVYNNPKLAQSQLKIEKRIPLEDKKNESKQPKKVFGLSRNAITSNQNLANQVDLKAGNTVAKEPDQLKLEKEDPDSISIPTDDYLVTAQVKLLKDIKIPYPELAKKSNIEGPVVMDVVIDRNGKVYSVELVRGPGSGLNEAALEAVKSFIFQPAQVGEQKVAVKIRYTYRFVLESR